MAEVLVQFAELVYDDEGRAYVARAVGREMPDSRWQGWIEFLPEDGGTPLRSGRETTQPNRVDTEYWATGLTEVYLEGAMRRALKPQRLRVEEAAHPPVFDGPADEDSATPPVAESILNPFSVYRKGEALLRSQLGALSTWHLANIALAHRLSVADAATLNRMSPGALIDLIVAGVQERQPSL